VGAEPLERLLEVDVPQVLEDHGDEARVQQVQHRVLVAADVQSTGSQPRVISGSNARVVVADRRVAQEVPGGVEEGVGYVRLPPRPPAAGGAVGEIPLLVARERRDARGVRLVILDDREDDRKLLLGYRHRAALVAVEDRDRGPQYRWREMHQSWSR
jgi:hypothetical protein